MAEVDLVVLCLPDEAAKEAVALADALQADAPKIIDASTAHRVAPGWVYGFPEMTKGHAAKVKAATRVTNPGCYPTGAIALIRPLVEAGLMPADFPVTVNAVSGYSGGGKAMIETFDNGTAPSFELYGLGLAHKHVPELQQYGLLKRRPLFVPSVGNYRQGMLVSVPLHLATLPGTPKVADLQAALAKHYGAGSLVRVMPLADDPAAKGGRLEAESLNGTDVHGVARVRQRYGWPCGSGRQARQPRQGRVRRGGAVPRHDARRQNGLSARFSRSRFLPEKRWTLFRKRSRLRGARQRHAGFLE